MANTVVLNPYLYTKPPKNPMPGTRTDYQQMAMSTTYESTTTNIYAIAVLPANCRVKDIRLESDQLDQATAITVTVGLLNGYYSGPVANATGTTGWDGATTPQLVTSTPSSIYNVTGGKASTIAISASTTPCRAGGWIGPDATYQLSNAWGVDQKNDRIVGIQFSAAAVTAAAGYIGLSLSYDIGLPGNPGSSIPASD